MDAVNPCDGTRKRRLHVEVFAQIMQAMERIQDMGACGKKPGRVTPFWPTPDQASRILEVRDMASVFVRLVCAKIPDCGERQRAVASIWLAAEQAERAIAQSEDGAADPIGDS